MLSKISMYIVVSGGSIISRDVGMVFRDTWARALTAQALIPEAVIKVY